MTLIGRISDTTQHTGELRIFVVYSEVTMIFKNAMRLVTYLHDDQILLQMLEDQLPGPAGCLCSLPDDQTARGSDPSAPPALSSVLSRRLCAPLHLDHRGRCASSQLDQALDLN